MSFISLLLWNGEEVLLTQFDGAPCLLHSALFSYNSTFGARVALRKQGVPTVLVEYGIERSHLLGLWPYRFTHGQAIWHLVFSFCSPGAILSPLCCFYLVVQFSLIWPPSHAHPALKSLELGPKLISYPSLSVWHPFWPVNWSNVAFSATVSTSLFLSVQWWDIPSLHCKREVPF